MDSQECMAMQVRHHRPQNTGSFAHGHDELPQNFFKLSARSKTRYYTAAGRDFTLYESG
jgi:hypothetical protein